MEYLTADNISFAYLNSGVYSSNGKVTDLGGVSNRAVKEIFTVKWKMYVVDMITEGCAKITVNGIPHTYRKGDINIRKPNDIISQDPYSDYKCTFFHIRPKSASEEKADNNKEYGCILDRLPSKMSPGNFETLIKIAGDMQRYVSADGECGEYFKKMIGMRFIAELCKNTMPEKLPVNNKYHPKLSKALAYIDNNLYNCDHISVETLANEAGLTVKYFQRAFKEATGKTPGKFTDDRRMYLAMLSVRDTDSTILKIADTFGFSSSSYFSKCFKNRYGLTPLAYRKSF